MIRLIRYQGCLQYAYYVSRVSLLKLRSDRYDPCLRSRDCHYHLHLFNYVEIEWIDDEQFSA